MQKRYIISFSIDLNKINENKHSKCSTKKDEDEEDFTNYDSLHTICNDFIRLMYDAFVPFN